MIIAVALSSGCFSEPDTTYQFTKLSDLFPSVDQIKHMSAMAYEPDMPEFEVEMDHWPRILNALLPAKLDLEPTTWEVLGRVQITTREEQTLVIDLYFVDDTVGAFAVDRTYYLGGNATKHLLQLLTGGLFPALHKPAQFARLFKPNDCMDVVWHHHIT